MLTQIVTFLIIFAIIGCILYGRKLIRTEKVDAVFGNPERALGGTHWVIVGSGFLIFIWLYYSWDIAKGFYPQSANELCQVAKVNDSLLGLKYQFPIEERELKSTSQIKQENKNLKIIDKPFTFIKQSIGIKKGSIEVTKFLNNFIFLCAHKSLKKRSFYFFEKFMRVSRTSLA